MNVFEALASTQSPNFRTVPFSQIPSTGKFMLKTGDRFWWYSKYDFVTSKLITVALMNLFYLDCFVYLKFLPSSKFIKLMQLMHRINLIPYL